MRSLQRISLLRVAQWLIGGAALTAIVALACSAWAPTSSHTFRDAPFDERGNLIGERFQRISSIIDDQWRPQPSALKNKCSVTADQLVGVGFDNVEVTVMYSDGNCTTGNSVAFLHRAGLPFRALSCECVLHRATWDWSWSWKPPAWFGGRLYSTSPGDSKPPLPLRPEPLGFAANTGFFALMLALTTRAPGILIRHIRVHKGRCVSCGYDLTATRGRCPECGAACSEVSLKPPLAPTSSPLSVP